MKDSLVFDATEMGGGLLGDAVFAHVLCVTVQYYVAKFFNVSAELLSFHQLLLQHLRTHPVLFLF